MPAPEPRQGLEALIINTSHFWHSTCSFKEQLLHVSGPEMFSGSYKPLRQNGLLVLWFIEERGRSHLYKYVIRRLLLMIPIILGVTFIVFFISSLTPGSPGRIILGTEATQEQVDEVNHRLGYDKPFFERYCNYVIDALHGDFGESYKTGGPVFDEIFKRFPTTLLLACLCITISAMVGIPLGIYSAVKQYSPIDVALTILAMLMASVPTFWLGLMLILVFAIGLKLLPVFGIGTPAHYVLPTLTLSFAYIASFIRITRSSMLETIRADYVRTARAKGATERMVIWRHALKNALMPVVTMAGMYFGALLGGTVLIESVFALPGLGDLILSSIMRKDIPMVMGCTVFLSTLFCVIMLIVDLAYAFLDPRIKAKFSR